MKIVSSTFERWDRFCSFFIPLMERFLGSRLSFIWILVLAALLRLVRWYGVSLLNRDSIHYMRFASLWKSYSFDYTTLLVDSHIMPFYVFLIKILNNCGISFEFSGILISIISGVGTVIIFYWIGLLMFKNRCGALILMLLAACQPTLGRLSSQLLRDSLGFLLFSGSGLGVLCIFRKMYGRGIILTGCFLGAALLTRYENFEFLLILFVGGIAAWSCKHCFPKKYFFSCRMSNLWLN